MSHMFLLCPGSSSIPPLYWLLVYIQRTYQCPRTGEGGVVYRRCVLHLYKNTCILSEYIVLVVLL